MVRFGIVAILLIFSPGVEAFVYSCDAINAKLLNSDFSQNTTFACLVGADGFSNFASLKTAFAVSGAQNVSLFDIMNSPTRCVLRRGADAWRLTAAAPLDCTQPLTLVLTSAALPLLRPGVGYWLSSETTTGVVIVSPRGGVRIHVKECRAAGVTILSGAGADEDEQLYGQMTWGCYEIPSYITSFDTVTTLRLSEGAQLVFEYAENDAYATPVEVGDRITVMTSTDADDYQNVHPERNVARFHLKEPAKTNAYYEIQLNASSNLTVFLGDTEKTVMSTSGSSDGSTYAAAVSLFGVQYNAPAVAPGAVWANYGQGDKFIMEFSTTALEPVPTTTTPRSTATTPLPTTPGERTPGGYCNCDLDKFLLADGWDTTQIWLDIVIILDTSEAMGADALADASSLIESFIGDEDVDVLITDPAAHFYTRIGLIAMSDRAEVIYNLNMTKSDVVGQTVKTGVTEINVVDAFEAAMRMLAEGVAKQPARADARQLIYYVTDSDPKINLAPLNQFKASQGIIVVNNFLEPGEVARPGLARLASDGFYFSDLNASYMQSIQVFCKANCFCKEDRVAWSGYPADPTRKAVGGCYHTVSAGIPYKNARKACEDNGGGILACPHTEEKNAFLTDLVTAAMPNFAYHWIGLSKLADGTTWQWEDNSTGGTNMNWNEGEPSTAAVAKCAYADRTTPGSAWGAGNCQIGFPFVCEYAPCSVGNNKC